MSLPRRANCEGVSGGLRPGWRRVSYLFSDLQSPLAQRLGLLVLPPLAVEHGQVVERGGDLDKQKQRTT